MITENIFNCKLFHKITKSNGNQVLLQKGHLKVTVKQNQAANFVLTA